MAEKIKLVQGDTRPSIICTLTDSITGDPIGLTNATVRMYFKATGATELTATIIGTVIDPINGKVAFFPSTAPEMLQGEAGDYQGEIEVTFEDGTIQTIYDILKFKVREDF